MKKVLILHTSVGLGHKSIAENIAWQLGQAGLEVKLADIGKVQSGGFEQAIISVHQFINDYLPFIWTWLYRFGHYAVLPFRVFIAGFNYKSTKALVDSFKPDLIITTQTTASAVISYLKKKGYYKSLFAVAFSDYHMHRYWMYKRVDFYLANTEEQKQYMRRLKTPAEKIFVCGITLRPKLDVDADAVKNRLGIGPEEKVVLVGSGSLGTGFKEQIIDGLVKLKGAKTVIVCGKNAEYKQYLEEKYKNSGCIILGFYDPMDELYKIADVFLTKPGGLSTAEALQWNTPVIITHYLHGQEYLNLKYLLNKGLVQLASKDLAAQVGQELTTRRFKNLLSTNPNVGPIVNPKLTARQVVLSFLSRLPK